MVMSLQPNACCSTTYICNDILVTKRRRNYAFSDSGLCSANASKVPLIMDVSYIVASGTTSHSTDTRDPSGAHPYHLMPANTLTDS